MQEALFVPSNHLKELCLGKQRAPKIALKLQVHTVLYAHN